MEDESKSFPEKGEVPSRVTEGEKFSRARNASQNSVIPAASKAMAAEAYGFWTRDEDLWAQGKDSATRGAFDRHILWFGCALAAVSAGALAFHALQAVGNPTTSEAAMQWADSPADSEAVNHLPELAKRAQQFLESPDVQEAHRIHSISEPASVIQIDGRDYVLQPVTLTDGIRRTAYFAISEDGLQFDRASFQGDTDQRWSVVARRETSIEDGWSLIEGGWFPEGGETNSSTETFGPCRLYVRPADYFNFEFASPEKFVCFKLDDADRQLSAYGYAPRDSAVARDLERVFGTEAVSSPTGLATERRWTAYSLTLELSVPEEPAPNQFLINRILSESWLLVSASQQNWFPISFPATQ